MEVLRIVHWSSYQSYKDRNPPWIRLSKKLLDNYDYQLMSANARALLPMLWLLASEDEDPVSGLLRIGYKRIAFRLRQPLNLVTDGVQEIIAAGFVELIQSCNESVTEALQNRTQNVTPEKETETETETYTPHPPRFDDDDFVKSYSVHPDREEIRQHIVRLVPGLGRRNASEIDRWLEAGADPHSDIYPVVDQIAQRTRGNVYSFAYFTPEIMRGVTTRKENDDVFKELERKYAEQDAAKA